MTDIPDSKPSRPPLLRPVKELLTNPPPLRWLIRGIMEAETLTVIYGHPGAGKSFVAIDMAACITCGIDWHGNRVTKGPAVYILGEGFGGISRRLRVWQRAHPDAKLEDAPLYISSRMVPLCEADAVAEIAAAIEESGVGKPSSVWIDTLARAAVGMDENSSRDMGELIKACDTIRQRYGCVVILVHHSGHNQDRARGSSVILGALDAEISTTKDGKTITVASTKAKESEGFKPLTFQLTSMDTGWNDEDGERVYSAVLEECEAPDQSDQLGKNQTICLGVLREMTINRQKNIDASGSGNGNGSAKIQLAEWKEGCGLSKQRFYDAKTSLVKLNLVEIQGTTVRVTAVTEGNG